METKRRINLSTTNAIPTTVQVSQDQEPRQAGPVIPLRFLYSDDIVPEWSSDIDRDDYLRKFWKKFGNDMLQSVLATAVAKIITQNWELEGPERLAKMYHRIIRDESDFGRGYSYWIARGVIDYYTQDNGWFIERQRASKDDMEGPCLGFAHLDSARMWPSGNAEYPYAYHDIEGEYHLMHRSQFIRIVDMPTPETGMYHHQRGFCALSRALSTSVILTMIVAMKREKLADLPPSAIAVFNNINRKQFQKAMNLKTLQDEAEGNIVWRQVLPLFGIDPSHPASIDFISLREVWEGYDDMTQANIAAYSFAAAFRMDPREFWPVSQGPLGTGKEAEVQHQKAKAKSHGLIFTEIERAFNASDSLPDQLQFKFALQDIEEEKQKADIHAVQISNIAAMQSAGAGLTPQEVRHLLAVKYKVIPRIMAELPAEGQSQELIAADVVMDDVERQIKEFGGLYFGPVINIDSNGKKEYVNLGWQKKIDIPLLAGLKGGPGSGNFGHGGLHGVWGGSGEDNGKDEEGQEEDPYSQDLKFTKIVEHHSDIEMGKWGKGYFIREDGSLVDVTSDFGGGTNDHVGFFIALDNPDILGVDVDLADRAKQLLDSMDVLSDWGGEEFRKLEDEYYDVMSEVWHDIDAAGNIRVRVWDLPSRGRSVAIDGPIDRVSELQNLVLDGKIPSNVDSYSWDSRRAGYFRFTYDELMSAEYIRDLKYSRSKEFSDPSYHDALLEFGTKENVLASLDEKIASYDREIASRIRDDAHRLVELMSPMDRMDKVESIPDGIWDRAIAADELDAQMEES